MRKKGLEYHFWWVVGGIHSPSSSECSTVCPPIDENDDEGSAGVAVHLLSIRQLRCRHLSYLMMGKNRAGANFTIELTWQLRMGTWKCSHFPGSVSTVPPDYCDTLKVYWTFGHQCTELCCSLIYLWHLWYFADIGTFGHLNFLTFVSCDFLGNANSRESRIPGKSDFWGIVISLEGRLPGTGSHMYGILRTLGHLDIRTFVLCDFPGNLTSRERWLPRKGDFPGKITSRESKFPW